MTSDDNVLCHLVSDDVGVVFAQAASWLTLATSKVDVNIFGHLVSGDAAISMVGSLNGIPTSMVWYLQLHDTRNFIWRRMMLVSCLTQANSWLMLTTSMVTTSMFDASILDQHELVNAGV